MGALEIPVLCYSWMVFFTWARTSFTTRGRGGALVSSYEHHLTERAPGSNTLRITEEKLWETYEYFLRKVGPVAEKAGVRLTLHPDDPPLSPVMGVSRIFGKPENYDRAMAMMESEANAICFCQANFGLMDCPARVPELIRHYGKRIGFVHFRDVRGDAQKISSRRSTMKATPTCSPACRRIETSASTARYARTMRPRWKATRTCIPATKRSAGCMRSATCAACSKAWTAARRAGR